MQNAYDDQIFKTGKFMLSEFDKKFIAYLNDVYDLKIIYIINVICGRHYYISILVNNAKDLEAAKRNFKENEIIKYWKKLNKEFNFKINRKSDINLTLDSLEFFDMWYCISNSQYFVETKILPKYPYQIEWNLGYDASNNFLFYEHEEFEEAKQNGTFDKLRRECFPIVKSLDNLGYVNENTYVTGFYDFTNLDKNFRYRYI
jgi:hypothetical protein